MRPKAPRREGGEGERGWCKYERKREGYRPQACRPPVTVERKAGVDTRLSGELKWTRRWPSPVSEYRKKGRKGGTSLTKQSLK